MLSHSSQAVLSQELRSHLMSLPLEERLALISEMTDQEALALLYDWDLLARPTQLRPEPWDWLIWLIMTGRGWGKTLTGAETTRRAKERYKAQHIALVGPTAADVRDVMLGMEPDSSGLMQVCPPWDRPVYEPSKRHAVWADGATATLYSSEEPDRLRGPQHDFAWGDEPVAWEKQEETLDMLLFGLRRGDARLVLTTTPNPTAFMKGLKKMATVITAGSMKDNPFLSPVAQKRLIDRYEGTRLGRQEIDGELLDDNPDALWSESALDADRITPEAFAQAVADGRIVLRRVVTAVDPAVTSGRKSNETGIITAAIDTQTPPHAYVLADDSIIARPEGWSLQALRAYTRHHADRIVGEVNNGGDLIESVIRAHPEGANVSYRSVRATRGKMLRAEPVSALSEKHRVHMVGYFPQLEAQLTEYNGSQASPDRLDAFVWAMFELIIDNENSAEDAIAYLERRAPKCPSCGAQNFAPGGVAYINCRVCHGWITVGGAANGTALGGGDIVVDRGGILVPAGATTNMDALRAPVQTGGSGSRDHVSPFAPRV